MEKVTMSLPMVALRGMTILPEMVIQLLQRRLPPGLQKLYDHCLRALQRRECRIQ